MTPARRTSSRPLTSIVIPLLALASLALTGANLPAAPPAPHDKPYAFFPFCIDMPDAKHRTLDEQAAMLKELGYDGVGHIGLDKIPERLKTLDAAGLRLYQVTMWIDISADSAKGRLPYDKRMAEIFSLVKGRGVQFLLIVNGGKPSDASMDRQAVKIVRELSDLAKDSGSQLLLYPHTGNWVERIEDAVRVAEKVDRPNVGAMFNLCHWLRVDKNRDYRSLLAKAMPRLWAVSICGADEFDSQPGWSHYIQPLDKGNFDLGRFLRTIKELGYKGSIGVQCYGIGGDAREHLARSMAAWQKLKTNLDE
jgi:sugar phosphate isomerase/epimerase